jgi:hypothetical protein
MLTNFPNIKSWEVKILRVYRALNPACWHPMPVTWTITLASPFTMLGCSNIHCLKFFQHNFKRTPHTAVLIAYWHCTVCYWQAKTMLYVSTSTDTPRKWVWTVAETCSNNIFINYCKIDMSRTCLFESTARKISEGIWSLVNQLYIPDVHYAHNISPTTDIAKCNYIKTVYVWCISLPGFQICPSFATPENLLGKFVSHKKLPKRLLVQLQVQGQMKFQVVTAVRTNIRYWLWRGLGSVVVNGLRC